jgi:ankyrin repeat protein
METGNSTISESMEKLSELLARQGLDINTNQDSWSPLLQAAANCDNETVQRLLETTSVDLDLQDPVFHQSPLSWATERGHESIVRQLLRKGANPDLKDVNGQTPLSWAAEKGHLKIAQELLKQPVDPDSRDIGGRTPLFWAAEKGHVEVVQLLLCSKSVAVDAKDNHGQTPLWWAARNGHASVARILLEKGADVDVITKGEYSNLTGDHDNCGSALFMAGNKGHVETVKVLLEFGANVHVKCSEIDCPLLQYLVIIKTGKRLPWDILRLLIEHGADLDYENDSIQQCIFYAARDGDVKMIEFLLDHGAGMKNVAAALHRAIIMGRHQAVEVLLSRGADIEGPDEYGDRPLHFATSGRREGIWSEVSESDAIRMVKILLDRGANINSRNDRGETALHKATKKIANLLIENGAIVEEKDGIS